jgi:hypothetical protein
VICSLFHLFVLSLVRSLSLSVSLSLSLSLYLFFSWSAKCMRAGTLSECAVHQAVHAFGGFLAWIRDFWHGRGNFAIILYFLVLCWIKTLYIFFVPKKIPLYLSDKWRQNFIKLNMLLAGVFKSHQHIFNSRETL